MFSGYKRFIFTGTWSDMNMALTHSLGNFIEKPLQLSSAPVKLQKRSQRGGPQHSQQSAAALPVCLSTLLPPIIGIIVRLGPPTNWAFSWRGWGHVIEGTCFWRRSRGHVTFDHVGATVGLIKWLPLISSVHMKGLCLLDDRLYASSPRDLPRCTKTAATMYGAVTCVCVCARLSVFVYRSVLTGGKYRLNIDRATSVGIWGHERPSPVQ